MASEYVIGVDVGGTCTDCVILDDQGEITVSKAFSTPGNFSEGELNAIGLGAEALNTDVRTLFGQTRLLLHATTIAENAILTGNLAPGGMLFTRGFEDTLALMRGGYAEWAGRPEEEIKNVPYVSRPPTSSPTP